MHGCCARRLMPHNDLQVTCRTQQCSRAHMLCVQARSLSTSDVDWTMPKRLIQTKAFALNANNAIGDMIRTQACAVACSSGTAPLLGIWTPKSGSGP